jgi:hypothetical protein
MPIQGSKFRRRKKEDIFAEGYFVDHATVFLPGVDKTDETSHIFGFDDPVVDVAYNQGTCQITVLDKFTTNTILDLCTGNDPSSTAVREYNSTDMIGVTVWANVKDLKNTRYVKSIFVDGWAPGFPLPSGDPNSKAEVQFTGNSSLPRQFHGAWIKGKKVASSASPASIGDTPVAIPDQAALYAVGIKAINHIVGPPVQFLTESIVPTAAMLTSAGMLDTAQVFAACTELTAITHTYVYYLQTGAGVYPASAQNPGKIRA